MDIETAKQILYELKVISWQLVIISCFVGFILGLKSGRR
jgi:hypothetical protein